MDKDTDRAYRCRVTWPGLRSLTWEAEAASDARHHSRDQVVKVTEGGGGELQCPEADIVQGLIVEDHALICVLHQLVDRQSGVVWLHNCVGHLCSNCSIISSCVCLSLY
jgi:hypothetical protein